MTRSPRTIITLIIILSRKYHYCIVTLLTAMRAISSEWDQRLFFSSIDVLKKKKEREKEKKRAVKTHFRATFGIYSQLWLSNAYVDQVFFLFSTNAWVTNIINKSKQTRTWLIDRDERCRRIFYANFCFMATSSNVYEACVRERQCRECSCVDARVCVCVCVWERERERERETKSREKRQTSYCWSLMCTVGKTIIIIIKGQASCCFAMVNRCGGAYSVERKIIWFESINDSYQFVYKRREIKTQTKSIMLINLYS